MRLDCRVFLYLAIIGRAATSADTTANALSRHVKDNQAIQNCGNNDPKEDSLADDFPANFWPEVGLDEVHVHPGVVVIVLHVVVGVFVDLGATDFVFGVLEVQADFALWRFDGLAAVLAAPICLTSSISVLTYLSL